MCETRHDNCSFNSPSAGRCANTSRKRYYSGIMTMSWLPVSEPHSLLWTVRKRRFVGPVSPTWLDTHQIGLYMASFWRCSP
ncbi:uncharacterized protein QC761_106895 [Podospora bellae-mahoneyi]|uniref:Uncharacterized protein n=1 Tax=Podospora bellae-mahoneyi TaxID=2093777 RepID=A0ABR0FVT5_9PEZI|nr:hypothetical protein QC761_106895 [Podospora bellae-mahoneyi]